MKKSEVIDAEVVSTDVQPAAHLIEDYKESCVFNNIRNQINKCINDVKDNYLKLGKLFDYVIKKQYYKQLDYKSFEEFIEGEYGFSRRTANNLIAIYRKFAKLEDDSFNTCYIELKPEYKDYACELLRGMIDLKKPSKKDTNKSRWESDATWLLFLNNVKKTKFSVSPKRFSNVERKMSWRDYSMTRMNLIFDLADAYCRDEHGNDWMDPTIARAVHEMEMMIHYFEERPLDANDLALINQYRFNHTMTLLSLDDVYKKMDEMKKRVQFLTEKFTFPF